MNTIVVLCILPWSQLLTSLPEEDYPKRSPFSELRWSDSRPEARIGGTWYAVHAVNGVPIDDILSFCEKNWPNKVRRRFVEDLVEVLSKMGKAPGASTTIDVTNLETGSRSTLRDVPMTRANRQRLRSKRIRRPERKASVTAEQALHDINDFQRQLESRFAYLHANHVDYKSALNKIRASVTDPMDVNRLEAEIGKVISMFIDGHASPRGINRNAQRGHRLPFLLEISGDRFVAVNRDRQSLVAPGFPYVASIDGIRIERWIAAMDPFIAQGSPQHDRARATNYLNLIDHARRQLERPTAKPLALLLRSEDGTKQTTMTVEVPDNPPPRADMRYRNGGLIAGSIGYLRLPTFEGEDAVNRIREWMPRFQDSTGLIIDIRDNGGGSREALRELFPYFLKPGEVRIGNVCAYRLYERFSHDHLASRFAYREDDERWTKVERTAIRRFAATFRPEWTPPQDQFSQWHYLVLTRAEGDGRYYYDKPVVLLTNPYCFSATDIFAGAFKGHTGVTIMGQSTSGGSACSKRETLPYSGIEVRLASMASFQPDGLLYDGRGVAVDVFVAPSPESFLLDGNDNVLQAGIDFIQATRKTGEE